MYFLVWGEFNLPEINWTDESINGNRYPKPVNTSFLNLLQSLNLTQVVNFSTRASNTLDLLVTNRPNLVHKLAPCPGISDHDSIVNAEIDCRAQVHRPVKRKIYQWHKLSDLELIEIRNYVKTFADTFLSTHKYNTCRKYLA